MSVLQSRKPSKHIQNITLSQAVYNNTEHLADGCPCIKRFIMSRNSNTLTSQTVPRRQVLIYIYITFREGDGSRYVDSSELLGVNRQ